MKQTIAVVGVLTLALAVRVFAVEPQPGWGRYNDYEQALEHARKNDLPVVVLYAFRKSSCPLHNQAAQQVMRDRSTNGMVRIVIYTDDPAPALDQWRRTVKATRTIPETYLLDSSGTLRGFVDYKEEAKLPQVAATVGELVSWRAAARKQIDAADRSAGQGRFAVALKSLEQIEQQDRAATAGIRQILPLRDAPDDSEALPEKGEFYPDLLETKRAEYQAMAEERVAQARAAIEQEQFAEARRHLFPMARDASGFEAVKEAQELLKQIQQAEIEARRARQAAAD
jgi:hypothetical protein